MLKLQGVLPALVTPFDAAGQVDLAAFERHLSTLRADSWICGPANCMAKPVCQMDAAFRAGDQARAKQIMQAVWPAMNVLGSGKFVQKLKFGCELQGNPVGDCRMPFGPLTDAEKAEFAAAMQPILNWE